MKICFVSRHWPGDERSGVTLAAEKHAEILANNGYAIALIGSGKGVLKSERSQEKYHVPAQGSGALYSPARLDKALLEQALKKIDADLVVVEAWQTALTDGVIELASQMDLPILMISHGISLSPHSLAISQLARSFGWQLYKYLKLPRLIRKLNLLTALDLNAKSPRFYDRDLALKLNVPVVQLVNSSLHSIPSFCPHERRKRQVLVLGYFSAIKNQLGAISVMTKLQLDISFLFVGLKSGSYYQACVDEVNRRGLKNRVTFKEDHECNLSQEISESLIIYAPSLTEALPVALLEAMACGTPFVATPVGANASLKGGILVHSKQMSVDAIHSLTANKPIWEEYSLVGRVQYQNQFTESMLERQLLSAIEVALGKGFK
jgi:glycosyltransferase involved in cell wall biosynthesis